MKKYLLIIAAAFLAIPTLISCSGASGDPEKDAEAFKDLFEEQCELDLKTKKKLADELDHYSKNENLTDWDEYNRKCDSIRAIIKRDQYYDKIEDLKYKLKNVEDELIDEDKEDMMNLNNYDSDDYDNDNRDYDY